VGLLEAREHVGHDGAGVSGGGGGFDFGAELVVDGLPIEAAQLGVPVFVADGLPDHFEESMFNWRWAGLERAGREKARRPPAAGPGPRVETASSNYSVAAAGLKIL